MIFRGPGNENFPLGSVHPAAEHHRSTAVIKTEPLRGSLAVSTDQLGQIVIIQPQLRALGRRYKRGGSPDRSWAPKFIKIFLKPYRCPAPLRICLNVEMTGGGGAIYFYNQ